jgi:dipeptidyl aminopeptidase/acylaminoacyl peptidase
MTSGGNAWSPQRMGLRLRLDEVDWTPDNTPAWLEGRSDRSVVVSQNPDGSTTEWTHLHSVRGGVGYGGGDFAFSSNALYYAERGGSLWRQGLETTDLKPVLPRFGSVASPSPSPDGRWVLCVHSHDGQDVLAICDAVGARWPTDLVRGADFYMQPVWHPNSQSIAWIEWDHPQMPWDGAKLFLASLDTTSTPKLLSKTLLDGSESTPVLQPQFSPDGRYLAWIGTKGNHYSLRLYDFQTQELRDLWESPALLPPAWVQGVRVFAWRHDSEALWLIAPEMGKGNLLELSPFGSVRTLDAGKYQWFSQIRASLHSPKFIVLASAPDVPDEVAVWEQEQWSTIMTSDPTVREDEYFPRSRSVSWEQSHGRVHGILHEPPDADPTAALPLLISVHGGPTSQKTLQFSPDTAFFVSRGWRVLDVNYRGSTGYGEAYRTALDGNWGIVDVEDCTSGAMAMVQWGLTKPEMLIIKGGSAGGYTVLRCLIEHPGLFRAGISNYGVTDLLQLAATTHKFEARYLDRLVAPLPEGESIYKERSPLTDAVKITDALAIFQGSDDRVVPLAQAKALDQALTQSGTPHLFKVYEGEGHGWRQNTTIIDYYQTIEEFLNTLLVAEHNENLD